jgi:hypothetical protein
VKNDDLVKSKICSLTPHHGEMAVAQSSNNDLTLNIMFVEHYV